MDPTTMSIVYVEIDVRIQMLKDTIERRPNAARLLEPMLEMFENLKEALKDREERSMGEMLADMEAELNDDVQDKSQ